MAQAIASLDLKDHSRSCASCLVSSVSHGKLFSVAKASAEVRNMCESASCAKRTPWIPRAYCFPWSIWLAVVAAYTSDEVQLHLPTGIAF